MHLPSTSFLICGSSHHENTFFTFVRSSLHYILSIRIQFQNSLSCINIGQSYASCTYCRTDLRLTTQAQAFEVLFIKAIFTNIVQEYSNFRMKSFVGILLTKISKEKSRAYNQSHHPIPKVEYSYRARSEARRFRFGNDELNIKVYLTFGKEFIILSAKTRRVVSIQEFANTVQESNLQDKSSQC